MQNKFSGFLLQEFKSSSLRNIDSMRLIIPLILLATILTGCRQGYQKIDNKWAYVSYDEGVGKRVKYLEVDEQSFEILTDKEYAKDRSKVLLSSNEIKGADPKTFRGIGKGYSADASQVFMDLEIVIGANPNTFKTIEFPYSKDDKTIFCGTLPLKVDRIQDFKVTKRGDMKHTEETTNFIKHNPEFSFIDPLKYSGVIYADGEAETLTEKFEGYKKKK